MRSILLWRLAEPMHADQNSNSHYTLLHMTAKFQSVAVVDDDPRVRKLIGLTLNELGVGADFYSEPFELLRIVNESRPKLILLDLMMPQMDGVECCRQLRQLGSDAYLCIVTALYDKQMVHDAISAGANRYIAKSDVFEVLEDLIKESESLQ